MPIYNIHFSHSKRNVVQNYIFLMTAHVKYPSWANKPSIFPGEVSVHIFHAFYNALFYYCVLRLLYVFSYALFFF